ncbi:MAG: type IV pili methyl-accepting chemotaxis transducer N-terminal domain-containing protein [Bacteroidota bacterium]
MERQLKHETGGGNSEANIKSNKSLYNRYITSVIIAISLLIVNAFYIQYSLSQKREDATQINIAGRQRMLSQKLLVELYEYQTDSTLPTELVKATATVWQASHQALLEGSQYISIGPVKNQSIRTSLQALSPIIESVVGTVQALPKPTSTLSTLTQKQARFLNEMDFIVFELEEDSRKRVAAFLVVEVSLLVLSMVIILVEVRYIYLPFIQSLQKSSKKIETQRAKFESIINSTQDGIIYIDLGGNLIDINRAAASLLQGTVTSPTDLGPNVLPKLPKLWHRAFRIASRKVLNGHSIRTEISLPVNGAMVWLMASCYPVYNATQELVGMAVNLVDIDQQKRNELHIKNQNRRFKIIAARQSHDLRGKLASIMGLIRIIRIEDNQQNKLELVDRLEPLAEQMDLVIHDIVAQTQTNETAQIENS